MNGVGKEHINNIVWYMRVRWLLEVIFVKDAEARDNWTLLWAQWFHVWSACHFEVMTLLENAHWGKRVKSISTCLLRQCQAPFHCKAQAPPPILLLQVEFYVHLETLLRVWKVRRPVRVLNLLESGTILLITFRFPSPFLLEYLLVSSFILLLPHRKNENIKYFEHICLSLEKYITLILTSVTQLVPEALPWNQKVERSIPGQGTNSYLSCKFDSWSLISDPWSLVQAPVIPGPGACGRQPINVFLSHWCFSLSPPL